MTPAEVLASRPHVLLDFDGPVCAVFGGELSDRAVADELKPLINSDLPTDIAVAHDPFDILRYASEVDRNTKEIVEARFRELEVQAVSTAPGTPGAKAAIEALVCSGRTVTIVSNNSTVAVRRYLDMRGLARLVHHVSARESADSELLKPRPFLLHQAIDAVGASADSFVMVGDSASDVDAAHAAGTAVIAYANKPGKREQLAARRPDALIDRMTELTL